MISRAAHICYTCMGATRLYPPYIPPSSAPLCPPTAHLPSSSSSSGAQMQPPSPSQCGSGRLAQRCPPPTTHHFLVAFFINISCFDGIDCGESVASTCLKFEFCCLRRKIWAAQPPAVGWPVRLNIETAVDKISNKCQHNIIDLSKYCQDILRILPKMPKISAT